MRSYEVHMEWDLQTTISTISNTLISDVYFYYFRIWVHIQVIIHNSYVVYEFEFTSIIYSLSLELFDLAIVYLAFGSLFGNWSSSLSFLELRI